MSKSISPTVPSPISVMTDEELDLVSGGSVSTVDLGVLHISAGTTPSGEHFFGIDVLGVGFSTSGGRMETHIGNHSA